MIINKEQVYNKLLNIIKYHYPYLWCKYLYKHQLGKKADFRNPKDINEKIQWLEFFTDTTHWAMLADKLRVRNFVKERVGEHILIPLLGTWEAAENIPFDSLPEKFVIKPNNGSYDCIIVNNKSEVDFDLIRGRMAHSLKFPFGFENAEPHYLRIKPCIIAEQLLETNNPKGLVDYKFWCINGKVHHVFVCGERDSVTHKCKWVYYDINWTRHIDKISEKYRNDFQCPIPQNFQTMIKYAEKLSYGLPQVRVDLYNIDGVIYFGEMTLTSNYGMIPYYTQEVLDEMGVLCVLPVRSIGEKLKCFFKRWFPVI